MDGADVPDDDREDAADDDAPGAGVAATPLPPGAACREEGGAAAVASVRGEGAADGARAEPGDAAVVPGAERVGLSPTRGGGWGVRAAEATAGGGGGGGGAAVGRAMNRAGFVICR